MVKIRHVASSLARLTAKDVFRRACSNNFDHLLKVLEEYNILERQEADNVWNNVVNLVQKVMPKGIRNELK